MAPLQRRVRSTIPTGSASAFPTARPDPAVPPNGPVQLRLGAHRDYPLTHPFIRSRLTTLTAWLCLPRYRRRGRSFPFWRSPMHDLLRELRYNAPAKITSTQDHGQFMYVGPAPREPGRGPSGPQAHAPDQRGPQPACTPARRPPSPAPRPKNASATSSPASKAGPRPAPQGTANPPCFPGELGFARPCGWGPSCVPSTYNRPVPHLPGFLPDPERCRRWPRYREPYVRAQLPDGRTVDAKANAWQGNLVLIRWPEGRELPLLSISTDFCGRIPRHESVLARAPRRHPVVRRAGRSLDG